ncbi:LLM class flavin-dependent oxidoreductase [Nocardioides carbamazepini]|uniref:LLM class flavin-dependent oxidoreductase n=1 Tax=Nocardioides carbamazepini TaxID=2854259 RepID=UPI00214A2013|nr:LLM class flavin-dependent oxidoreductase [Nocardioides carbamazepini]MCR1784400.1 LLM class flavin-dependent oxidoreductase [Nocardioides carbamazepini]
MSLPIGIRLPPCAPATDVARLARRAEDLGFAQVFLPDSQMLWRDAFLTAYAVALQTESIRIGTAVSNVVTRHPSVVAGLTRTIGEAAPGRFDLGLGVGHSSVDPVGLRSSRQAELRAGVDVIRSVLAGDTVDFGPVSSRMRDPHPGVPVLLAASGPRNLQLAGEIADGAILLSGVSESAVARSRGLVEAGAREAGKAPEDVKIIVSAHAKVTDDIERDARILKPICAGIAQRGGRTAMQAAGIEAEVPAEVPGVYPDLVHAEDWDHAVDVCGEWISDADAVRFAQEFCLFGTAPEIAAKLDLVEKAGATSVFIQHVGSYDLPRDLVEEVGAEVLGASGR